MNHNVKKLKIIAVFLVIVIFALLYIVTHRSGDTEKPIDTNKLTLVNNDTKFVHYDNNVYYINNNKNSAGRTSYELCSLPINIDDASGDVSYKTLFNASNVVLNTNIKIFNNRLFYTYMYDTYMYDLATKENEKFCDGELQYITGNSFITMYEGALYRGNYYSQTLNISSYDKLTATDLTKLYEDDEMLYYKNNNAGGTYSLFGFNKTEHTILIYDKIPATSEILQVVTKDDYVYELVRESGETDDASGLYINKINKKIKIEPTAEEKKRINMKNFDEIFFIEATSDKKKDKNDLYFYGKETGASNSEFYVLKDGSVKEEKYTEELSEDSIKNYNVTFDNKYIYLERNGKEITKIKNPIKDASNAVLNDLEVIDEYVYYNISIDNSIPSEEEDYIYVGGEDNTNEPVETIAFSKYVVIARTTKDGGESYIMNDYK